MPPPVRPSTNTAIGAAAVELSDPRSHVDEAGRGRHDAGDVAGRGLEDAATAHNDEVARHDGLAAVPAAAALRVRREERREARHLHEVSLPVRAHHARGTDPATATATATAAAAQR